ncbi:PREDICTED: uncharacterized abhydrolase domain-containing protein DDB_G0269086-like [Papilio polytes]|uniref:uncharacterized abhydrolase domain-containing protein DDB_G0269086-like n=1 Tax=Papilio polytes TaxID=76194 RepID=UPI000675DAF1|nr:PREDICTED: uncharacterized abhydrolase domain-containing protein DDB_G0269086-like [Papilio polytes]
MDSQELLARENEFKKLNKELEKKTESLMKEIEHAMQKPDVFADLPHKLKLTPSPRNIKKHCCDTRTLTPQSADKQKKLNHPILNNKEKERLNHQKANTEMKKTGQNNCEISENYYKNTVQMCHNCMFNENGSLNNDIEFLHAFVSINIDDKILPQTFLKERVSVERVCKFLAAKVKLLQEQVDKMQAALDKQSAQCAGHLAQLATLEGARLAQLSQAAAARAAAADARAKCAALQANLEEKERQWSEAVAQAGSAAGEARRAARRAEALRGRGEAQQRALDTLTRQLETAKMAEKELRDASRALSAQQQTARGQLEARCGELAAAARAHAALADNLRRQNALLAAHAHLHTLEDDYTAFLNKDL